MESLTDFLSKFGVPIVVIGIAIAILGVIRLVVKNYKKVSPNEALVISGKGTVTATGKAGFRVVQGGATFVWPVFEKAETMRLGLMKIPVSITGAPNKDGVPVTIEAVANVKISNEQKMLMAAVERFLGMEPDEIMDIIKGVLEGTLRQILGTLTIEQIVQDREALSRRVVEVNGEELSKIGVVCDNFVISDVKDTKGYIDAMGARRVAEVKRDAAIATAEAERESIMKSSDAKRAAEQTKLNNDADIAAAQRDLQLKQAGYLSETAKAEAEAALAGEIAKTTTQQRLVVEQAKVRSIEAEQNTGVAVMEAALAEKKLIATLIKPAEAKRDADKISADGERQANIIRAEGAQRKAVIEATASAETLKLNTDAQAEAARTRANAEADAAKAKAGAEQARLTAEGEGKAAADAASKRQSGLAEAEVNKAKLLAEAEGTRAKGEAEGAAIRAKLLAEAEGIKAKNEALERMSEGARFILVLEQLPGIIDHAGDALQKAVTPMFQAIGQGIAGIDEIKIVDMGGNHDGKGGAFERFALSIPETVYRTLEKTGALKMVMPMLNKLGFQVKDGVLTATGDNAAPAAAASDADSTAKA